MVSNVDPIELKARTLKVQNSLETLWKAAITAINCGNYDVINLHAKSVRSCSMFDVVIDDVYTVSLISENIDSSVISWVDFAGEFNTLKSVLLPDYVSFVLSNESNILSRTFNGLDNPVHVTIPDTIKASLTTLTQAIIDTFEG